MKLKHKVVPVFARQKHTEVRVALVQDDVTFKVSLVVKVQSNAKPNLWADSSLDADQSPEKLRYAVQKVAEKLASFQCETYGDVHNPPEVGKTALAALEEVFAKADSARIGRGQG